MTARLTIPGLLVASLLAAASHPAATAGRPQQAPAMRASTGGNGGSIAPGRTASSVVGVRLLTEVRFQDDLRAVETYRPGYTFWRDIFRIPDGSIAYGSVADGRLLVVFPARGNWARDAQWADAGLAPLLAGTRLPTRLTDRRDEVARLLEQAVGPVVHNPTRGAFVTPNAERYGRFLEEWGRIYERFGVPPDLGLAQGLVESGLNGTARSEARALGFCQWLSGNWNVLKRLSPHVIEGYNQTTQAPYCAAYLSVLATKYGSFIPALSEHHAGGTNVGRTISNGRRLGGRDIREEYFMGADFTRDVREIAPRSYRDVYGTYGPRSYYYAEMVFGNMLNVRAIANRQPQATVYAMLTPKALSLADITRRTGLSADEVRRYNPALVRQVPARATVYLPTYVEAFGPDVSFWHRPAPPEYSAVLGDFLAIDRPLEDWDHETIVPTLRRFQERFQATRSEEGAVMAAVLGFTIQDIETSGRGAILDEFRSSPDVRRQFERAVAERNAMLQSRVSAQ